MPSRVVRLRSIDTNPIGWPSRLVPRGMTDCDRFAKCATVVTKLYSLCLDAGVPLVAKTSWARFIPTDGLTAALFSGVAMTADLGLGEVHEVPYDPAVLNFPDHDRRLAILDWLHAHLLNLAMTLHWDIEPLLAAFHACQRDGCRFVQRGKPKVSPNRRYQAYIEFEIDGEGDGWSRAVIADRLGAVLAVSDRRDSPATITASGRVRRSLRWQESAVTWMPWIDDVAPRDYQWWIGHIEHFALTQPDQDGD